ncbi:DUF2884 family protein [Dyella sp. 2HG41-7]|uniref:DUF2884 family protein n=1 Tax=Dyella sp. 2HG41-7 TaxID=2883239 RepID=UPI001F478B5F|nr:DUF2884 family protein [Dyella sp. 2HG41-7]
MRRYLLSSLPLLALAFAGGAQASGFHAHHDLECPYSTDYDVQVKPSGIAFTRHDGDPGDVFMHDGALRVDGHDVSVSHADAVRLRDYEQQVRDLVPAVAAIARDGVDIGYAALTTVVATLSEDADERTRLMQELRDRHADARQHIDDTLGRGTWQSGDGAEFFDHNLQHTVADMVGTVTGDVVKDALSGDPHRLAALQARTDSLDTTLDKAINEPADKLSQRAQALCPQLGQLQQLEQQFQFRLANGERLQLISIDKERTDKASQYAKR